MLSIYPIGDGINGNDAREILLSRPFLVFEMEITVNSVTLERFYRFVCIYIYIYIRSIYIRVHFSNCISNKIPFERKQERLIRYEGVFE